MNKEKKKARFRDGIGPFLLLIMSVSENPLIVCKLSELEGRYERELDQSNGKTATIGTDGTKGLKAKTGPSESRPPS
jgi:hypothetical protein